MLLNDVIKILPRGHAALALHEPLFWIQGADGGDGLYFEDDWNVLWIASNIRKNRIGPSVVIRGIIISISPTLFLNSNCNFRLNGYSMLYRGGATILVIYRSSPRPLLLILCSTDRNRIHHNSATGGIFHILLLGLLLFTVSATFYCLDTITRLYFLFALDGVFEVLLNLNTTLLVQVLPLLVAEVVLVQGDALLNACVNRTAARL